MSELYILSQEFHFNFINETYSELMLFKIQQDLAEPIITDCIV